MRFQIGISSLGGYDGNTRKKEVLSQSKVEAPIVEIVQPAIEKLIYVIRDRQVMVD